MFYRKQNGELAKQVMIKEKYYALTEKVTDVDERLGNEMADVIAQVMRLADYYNIDLEKAFVVLTFYHHKYYDIYM